MKAGFKKNMISMLMALALVATAIPFTAMAAGAETLRTPEVLMDLNGFIGREDLNGYVGRAVEKYYGTSTPHDGIDAYDESFISGDFAFMADWDDSNWLGKFFYVGEGSALNVTLRPDYTGDTIYVYPIVYALDDDGHVAYTVETSSTMEKMTSTPKTIFKFDNIEPMDALYGANGFLFGAEGTIPVEKLIYTIEIYKGDMQEDRVGVYNFLIADDGTPTEQYDQKDYSYNYAHGAVLEIPVNGVKTVFEAYTINQNNYMKLRDVAQVLTGTNRKFNVTWDSEKQAINLVSNQAYVPVGGELALDLQLKKAAEEKQKWQEENPNITFDVNTGLSFYAPKSKDATQSTSKIYLDGKEVSLTAYTINGNNYFKLRDLGKLFDFGVSWDGATNTVTIDTSTGYTAE